MVRTAGHPWSIHSKIAEADQRTREPSLTGAGMRPESDNLYTWRGLHASSSATPSTSSNLAEASAAKRTSPIEEPPVNKVDFRFHPFVMARLNHEIVRLPNRFVLLHMPAINGNQRQIATCGGETNKVAQGA
jgi:hypothetical protein